MATWTGEVSIRKQGKSYFVQPPTFVTVHASSYPAAVAAAVRDAKKRLVAGVRVETVVVKVTRVPESEATT